MLIGLTGGMGCGKSMALQEFQRLGWKTRDCDRIGNTLLAEDKALQQHIVDYFGPDVLDKKRSIDRHRLGNKVFCEKSALSWLEKTLHPLIHCQWQQSVAQASQANWVIEVPLLFEKKLSDLFDSTICVSASAHIQYARLATRALDSRQIAARLARQWPLYQKEIHADFILCNNGSPTFLYRQIKTLVQRLTTA